MTEHGRHRRRLSGLRRMLVPTATAAAVVAVLGTAVLATSLVGADRGRRSPTATAAQADTALLQATDRCRAARLQATQDLVAAGGSIQQWRLHIGAMNDLVAGKITLAQATAFWDATKVEGKRTLALWKTVDQHYRAAALTCAAPDGAPATQALQTCQRRQAAVDALLDAARGTLADWAEHIAQMDALRAGRITPAEALHMWHTMYQRGVVGLKAYDGAYRYYDGSPTCPLG
jgi:hypothetical protein